ncbi:hypothetical protein H1C71_011781, partial [Ictidomys tridecemlineatus]
PPLPAGLAAPRACARAWRCLPPSCPGRGAEARRSTGPRVVPRPVRVGTPPCPAAVTRGPSRMALQVAHQLPEAHLLSSPRRPAKDVSCKQSEPLTSPSAFDKASSNLAAARVVR